MKHEHAFQPIMDSETDLATGGSYHYRTDGEYHLLNPLTISKLQHAVRESSFKTFQEYTDLIDEQSRNLATLRSLLQIKKAPEPIPIEEVEPAKEIVKRFTTGAMSLGSISTEAHTTLAIAMNRIGGKSNTGEGGGDPQRDGPVKAGETLASRPGRERGERDIELQEGDSLRSRIKQGASAPFAG